jgi:hypothetical protein
MYSLQFEAPPDLAILTCPPLESTSMDDMEEPFGKPLDCRDELHRYHSRMEVHLARLSQIQPDSCSPEEAAGRDAAIACEDEWALFYYFFQASVVNAADLFPYLGLIYDNVSHFEALGAFKTLAAADELRPFYEEWMRLEEPARNAFYHSSREQRQPIEAKAEDMDEFGALLLAYARAHEAEFGSEADQEEADRQIYSSHERIRTMFESMASMQFQDKAGPEDENDDWMDLLRGPRPD